MFYTWTSFLSIPLSLLHSPFSPYLYQGRLLCLPNFNLVPNWSDYLKGNFKMYFLFVQLVRISTHTLRHFKNVTFVFHNKINLYFESPFYQGDFSLHLPGLHINPTGASKTQGINTGQRSIRPHWYSLRQNLSSSPASLRRLLSPHG